MGRITVALIVSSWVIPMSILVNHIVPEPYMDEIFHVPQAQQYCAGKFKSWDPMITTPPGLYFLSLAYVASLFPGLLFIQPALSFINACSIAVLRSTNGLLAVICSILVHDIVISLKPSLDDRKATLYTVVLALYPLHWFFTFLYYTDVASLAVVLAMYLMCLKKNYLCSALLGVVAVVVRQTNIIWMLFVACIGVLDLIQAKQKHEENLLSVPIDDHFASSRGDSISSNLKRRRSGSAISTVSHSVRGTSLPCLPDNSSGWFSEIWSIILASWHLKWELFVSFSPFLAVLAAFAAFVVWNGSIVLGAKEAHTVSPHFAQLLYYGLVSSCFMAPVHFGTSQAAILARSFWKNRPLSFLLWFLAAVVSLLWVHYFSIAHPYLLADNRHYPFYLWRKIINAHWSTKYLLVPLYVFSWTSIFTLLAKVQKKVWILAYFLASAAVLIPAPLIEFRYYTIPFFFLLLHCHVTNGRVWFLMGFLYTSINIYSMIMFLFRPFHWDHEPGVQRFIW
ncbi:dol-P-Glc:Glc(2)Man(9)GlcNAc(2)-PP-Dol alpha-1,2-glucosyltransferase [Cynara cardunculus var. scolymus]|uniref:dol-P-Glc:Glc(2)Man(9)GlcNAc(2)-PP-Dol alpha-1,2-glucosyltransferase n=1 Tax=Cynara cardunculus var. scolymus TaxID=59895 RepID=UPI000D62A18B|nr:dol-P-Glc:Glc(2)Man(9)GlcNAc(2)-PP-Dol alpha-1,2-glucosyltransferase [Cynara cardunculus var. scolymus]